MQDVASAPTHEHSERARDDEPNEMINENNPNSMSAARSAYTRSITEFGRLLKGTRREHRWTISHLAKLAGLPKQRLIQYEAGAVPIGYMHALLLAHALELHLTEMISALSAPLVSLSSQEFQALLVLARDEARPHWPAMRTECAREGAQRFETRWREMTFADVTLAGWPEFLPPPLEDLLATEATALNLLFDEVLGPIFDTGGHNPAERTDAQQPQRPHTKRGENIYQQLHQGLEHADVRLKWLQQRHRVLIPSRFETRVGVQRERLRHAMELLAPYGMAQRSVESVQEKKILKDFLDATVEIVQVQAGLNELAGEIRMQQ